MRSFLRKPRRSFIKLFSPAKHVLYAIVGIILVVIGILNALQVNNWNEKRKIQGVEDSLLLALKDQFESNLEKINKLIQVSECSKQNAYLHIEQCRPE